MQLFSVEQQRSQALEAHAASFATFKVRFFISYPIAREIHDTVTGYTVLDPYSFVLHTGCREREPFNPYLLCFKVLQRWTSYIKDACY